MSEPSNSLMPASRGELATATGTNPLVARGLASLQENRQVKQFTTAGDGLNKALGYYLRGLDWYGKHDYGNTRKDLTEAIRQLDETIRLDPGNVVAYRHRGKARWIKQIAEEMEEIDSAENGCVAAMKDFDEAIRLDPVSAISHIERGEAWLWGYSPAIINELEDFDEAIRLEPNNPAWYTLRGVAWSDLRDNAKAIEDFKAAALLCVNREPYVLIDFTSLEGTTAQYVDYAGGNPFLCTRVRVDIQKQLARVY